jgi:hypothetical protein
VPDPTMSFGDPVGSGLIMVANLENAFGNIFDGAKTDAVIGGADTDAVIGGADTDAVIGGADTDAVIGGANTVVVSEEAKTDATIGGLGIDDEAFMSMIQNIQFFMSILKFVLPKMPKDRESILSHDFGKLQTNLEKMIRCTNMQKKKKLHTFIIKNLIILIAKLSRGIYSRFIFLPTQPVLNSFQHGTFSILYRSITYEKYDEPDEIVDYRKKLAKFKRDVNELYRLLTDTKDGLRYIYYDYGLPHPILCEFAQQHRRILHKPSPATYTDPESRKNRMLLEKYYFLKLKYLLETVGNLLIFNPDKYGNNWFIRLEHKYLGKYKDSIAELFIVWNEHNPKIRTEFTKRFGIKPETIMSEKQE